MGGLEIDVKALSVTADSNGNGSIGVSQTIGEPKSGSLGYAVEANTNGNGVVSVEACAANLCQQPYAQMSVFQYFSISAFQHFSTSAFQHFSISAFQHFSISAFQHFR